MFNIRQVDLEDLVGAISDSNACVSRLSGGLKGSSEPPVFGPLVGFQPSVHFCPRCCWMRNVRGRYSVQDGSEMKVVVFAAHAVGVAGGRPLRPGL